MTTLLVAAVVATTPLLLAAIGGVVAERAGVFSISLEGYMLVGAFAAVWASSGGGPWAGFFAALAAGTLLAAVHAVLSVTMRVNQIVSGLALTILALGATGFLNQAIFGLTGSGRRVDTFEPWAIPVLSDIPVAGPVLFDQNVFTYLAIVALVAVVVFLRRTRGGLAVHAAGEFPEAAAARGISVVRTRYAAVLWSGALAGLGGAMLSIGQVGSFVTNMTGGRGFIALAAIIFAAWRPLGAAVACLLFGLADVAQVWANVFGVDVPSQFLAMIPYVVTIAALALLRQRRAMPGALGVPFAGGQR